MEDIYDRATWPPPESNPLVLMLRREEEWYTSREVNVALQPGRVKPKGSPMASINQVLRIIGEDESIISSRLGQTTTTGSVRSVGGHERFFSRKAVVLIAMRASTSNAAAFRDWLATYVAGEVSNG